MKRPSVCADCRQFFEGPAECKGCAFRFREVSVSWNYWLWAIYAQVHNLLRSTFRERRGVVQLLAVPPAVGFALLKHFASPRPGRAGSSVYTQEHPSYKQGTSKGGGYHFIKFAYDNMRDAEWGFPLSMLFPKTCAGLVRLVKGKHFSDPRTWGTPIQFKYRWAAQRKLGTPVQGVHTFTVMANINHTGLGDGLPRWNFEYARWVAEQQQEHIACVKDAIQSFPTIPLRATHLLSGVPHPLLAWAGTPTPLPNVIQQPTSAADAAAAADSDDDDNDSSPSDDSDQSD